MEVQEIADDDTGIWQITTITEQILLLDIPLDGRARIVALGTRRALPKRTGGAGSPPTAELVTWGRYSVLDGIGRGITVGQSAVLVLEPLGRRGEATAVITPPVLRIELLR